MSTNQVSLLNFNVFDILVNLIPGLFFTSILLHVLDLGMSTETLNSLTFFFAFLVVSYVFGHLIQHLSSRLYKWIFGFPTDLENKLQDEGVAELRQKYLQTEVNSECEAVEFDDTDLDSWVATLSEDPGFQSLEAKLIYLLEAQFRMQQTVSSIGEDQAGEVFQITFAYVVNQGVSQRVDRFFAIANLFRSLAFFSVGLGIVAAPLIWINGNEFSIYGWSGVLLTVDTIPMQLWDNAVFIFGLFATGLISHYIHRQYRVNLVRALVADFVSNYYPPKNA
ncbi:hypothetical protein [Halorarum salinum]|uniref:Uncharacterized protein n=1 Tax=Halorarum salinum TaxID=2743089 RepID=A0A7D5QDD0_9EURY|nr:hypothetical protein [Halobaculum salinum]QLG62001.1 hypothetical protein HUG12_09810 [Halobaculum salinum]